MSKNIDRALLPAYAGPAFYNSPPASSLPIPKWCQRSVSVTQLTLGAKQSLPDAIPHIRQASVDSEKCSSERKPISFTSDTKSQDGKRAGSGIKESDKAMDMVGGNSSKYPIRSCLTHHNQKPRTTVIASAQRSIAFEKLIKRLGEDNKAQAECKTAQRQASNCGKVNKPSSTAPKKVGANDII